MDSLGRLRLDRTSSVFLFVAGVRLEVLGAPRIRGRQLAVHVKVARDPRLLVAASRCASSYAAPDPAAATTQV